MNIWVESIQQCDSFVFLLMKNGRRVMTPEKSLDLCGCAWIKHYADLTAKKRGMEPHKLGDMTSTYCGSTNHLWGKYPTICQQ